MPIPPLQNKGRSPQNWRNNQSDYSPRKTSTLQNRSSNSRNRGQRNLKNFKDLFSEDFKKKIFKYAAIATVAGLLILFVMVIWISRNLPDPGQLIDREIAQTTKIYDRTGENVLYEIHGDQQRTIVALKDLPPYVAQATIAMEDKDFYKHGGISFWGILRGVVWKPLTGNGMQGGSTLTQQFVKNAILTNERTVIRKLKEWILAYRIEQKYNKDEILQMYFNEIPYGSTAYGIEAASHKYFDKNARDLSLAESAILAALPQGPSRYSPYGANIDLLIGRQHYILDLMVDQGYISKDDAEIAKAQELKFRKQEANILAPHFVMYVKELLSEKYGEKVIEQGGLKIITTLDLYKQKIAEEVITERADANEKNYNATNAALVSIDPKNGQVLAMVGSKDYFNDEINGQFNVATSIRQPGSSLKPLVYTACFLKGLTPNTLLYDVVTNFSSDPGNSYEPHNYDMGERGPVSIRKALAGSLNIPAVKAIYLAGIDNVLDLAKNFGYTTLTDKDRFGLSLVLGGAEVKLIEHVNAYSVFAREGLIHPTSVILKVEDADGKVLEEFEEHEEKVLDANIARMTNDILSDNNARSYVFGEKNWLTLGSRPAAAKTGTTNDYRDAWTLGYTPSLVTGVWVGNNDNSKMKAGADGSVVAAPIWNQYMKRVLGDTPVEYFNKPEIPVTGKAMLDGQVASVVKIDKASGLLATENTPEDMVEEKSFISPHSILYYIDKNDPLGAVPENPAKDPQFQLWESRVIAWAEKQKASSTSISTDAPPTESDNVHFPENKPSFSILSPSNNDTITDAFFVSRLDSLTAPRGINRAEYYIDDSLFFTNYAYPFNLEKQIDFLQNGYHKLTVVVCDDVSNCTSQEVEFNLNLSSTNSEQAVEISLLEPGNDSNIIKSNFPFTLIAQVNNPSTVAKVNFYYTDSENNKTLISSKQGITENMVLGSWKKPPADGVYTISAEAITWFKKIYPSNYSQLTIGEPSPENE